MALSPLLDTTPPSLLTTAARGGLRPAPDCRPRRALLHLSYSFRTVAHRRRVRDTRPFPDIRRSREIAVKLVHARASPVLPMPAAMPTGERPITALSKTLLHQ